MNELILILVLLTGIVMIKAVWIFTDRTPLRKTAKKELIKSNILELSILLLQALAAIIFPLPSTFLDAWMIYIGIFLYSLGIFFAVWGRISLSDTWGHPGKQVKDFQTKLITENAFSISRNPIYLGFLFIFFGYALAIRSILIILRIPLLLYFYRSIITEEKLLTKQFGKQYKAYMKRVPRFLFI